MINIETTILLADKNFMKFKNDRSVKWRWEKMINTETTILLADKNLRNLAMIDPSSNVERTWLISTQQEVSAHKMKHKLYHLMIPNPIRYWILLLRESQTAIYKMR